MRDCYLNQTTVTVDEDDDFLSSRTVFACNLCFSPRHLYSSRRNDNNKKTCKYTRPELENCGQYLHVKWTELSQHR